MPGVEVPAAGVDPGRLAALVQFAIDHESQPERGPNLPARKTELLRRVLGPGADVDIVGPLTPPGHVNGLVTPRGHVIAEFGDTAHVDEIASATKSFLSLLAGVAVDRGLIRAVHESVYEATGLELLDSPHNRRITWHHLLQQTSEWDGELFGKVPTGHRGDRIGEPLHEPGRFWEYNDVRVNLLARCLLEVFRSPLPEVLDEAIMTPIGASTSWSWHGYSTSMVTLDGRHIESVSGGSHWGGGIWMHAQDLAKVGLLYLNRGRVGGEQVISEQWIDCTRTSCDINYMHGYLWWLQHDRQGRQVCFAAEGGGSHQCLVIPDLELVIVVRWIDDGAWPELLDRALKIAVDHEPLGPVDYDFTRVNRA